MRFLALPYWQALLLVGLTAAAIAALYWLKPPPRRLLVPSNLLWRMVLKERKSSYDQLRWLISLLLALAIGVAIALAVGRPETDRAAVRNVRLILDNGPTMATRSSDGRSRWNHAVEAAEEILSGGSEGSRFLIMDTMGQVTSATWGDRRQARELLSALSVSPTGVPELPRLDTSDAETYIVSDGVSLEVPEDLPEGTHSISAFEPADNVGLTAFEIRPEPADPFDYRAYLEVENFSTQSKPIAIRVSGAGPHRLDRNVTLAPGEIFSKAFDLAEFEGGALRATVTTPADGFEPDNFAFSYLPPHRMIRVLLVSRGNQYLEAALRVDPGVDLSMWTPTQFQEQQETIRPDVFIFDRFEPDPLPGGPSILFGPPRSEVIEGPDVAGRDTGHPLLQFVSLEDLFVDRARRLDHPNAQVVLGTEELPLILAAEEPTRWVAVTFDLDDSNFPLQSGFPVFLSNVLTWATGEPLALKRSLGTVDIPLPDPTITDLEGKEIPGRPLMGKTVFEATEPGLYTAVQGNRRLRVAVNVTDRRISDVNRSTLPRQDTRPRSQVTAGGTGELWVFLLGAAILLLVLEWWTYHRRITI